MRKRSMLDEDSPKLRSILKNWLAKHPNPEDQEFHDYVEKELIPKGIVKDVHEAEDVMYQLSTEAAKFESEGKSNTEKSKLPKSIPSSTIRKGVKVELEHIDSPEAAKKIVRDHLVEGPQYYDELAKMEDRLKKMQKESMVKEAAYREGVYKGFIKILR